MNCKKCGSNKLKAWSISNLDYIFYYVNNKWVLSNPLIQSYYFHSKNLFNFICTNCDYSFIDHKVDIKNFTKDRLKHKEITLDLDKTLFDVEYAFELINYDFKFKLDQWTYYAVKRPHCDNFIKFLETKFDKINIFTAATKPYAEELIKNLNISEHKKGYVKTGEDTFKKRDLSFEYESMKNMNDSLMIDDKNLVINGFNNQVIKIDPFYHENKQDKSLLNIMKFLLKPELKTIRPPKTMDGHIDFRLRGLSIEFKDMPYRLYKKIISIPSKTQEEIDLMYCRMKAFSPIFEYNKNGSFLFSDCTYENYLKVMNLILPYTSSQILSENEYNQLLINKENESKSKANF